VSVECHEQLRGIRSSAKLSYWRCCAWNSDIRQSLDENIQASLVSMHLTRPSLSPVSHFSFQPAILFLPFVFFHHTSISLSFVLEDTKRQYYLLANPLSLGPSSDGTGPRHAMIEQGIQPTRIDPNMLTSTTFDHACRQTVTGDHVSNELQDLMVRYKPPK
jgi:hypothetical protein